MGINVFRDFPAQPDQYFNSFYCEKARETLKAYERQAGAVPLEKQEKVILMERAIAEMERSKEGIQKMVPAVGAIFAALLSILAVCLRPPKDIWNAVYLAVYLAVVLAILGFCSILDIYVGDRVAAKIANYRAYIKLLK